MIGDRKRDRKDHREPAVWAIGCTDSLNDFTFHSYAVCRDRQYRLSLNSLQRFDHPWHGAARGVTPDVGGPTDSIHRATSRTRGICTRRGVELLYVRRQESSDHVPGFVGRPARRKHRCPSPASRWSW